MTRVIHTADTHIGYRQYHSPERREDFLKAFDAVIADAIDLDVDAVVHAGDLFHDTRPNLDDLMETIRILRDLAEADIPFLGIVGNHERTRDRQWLDFIADLGLATRLDEAGTVVGDVTFYGLDWVPPGQRDRLAYTFDPPETDSAALVAHGLFEPFAHADWDTEGLLEAATVDFDAMLLGDNHTPDRAQVAGTWVTYPGSTERTGADEREERGYNLVTFDDDIRIGRRSIDGTRTFAFVDVSLAPGEGLDRVCERVRERDVADAVVVVRIDGEGEDVPPAAVEETGEDAGALLVRVIDTREMAESADRPAVHFADPDRAVVEAVDDLGLSSAGRMVDSIVRDRSIPDAGVRERVRDRVETLLGEAPEAFESGTAASARESSSSEGDGQTSIGEF